jgi:predicted transcriptional regulator
MKFRKISLNLPNSLDRSLSTESKLTRRTRTAIITIALMLYIEQQRKQRQHNGKPD